MKKRVAVALLVCSLGLPAGCKTHSEEATPRGPYNVILISIDTLRADRLGAYGYSRPTSPNIDALAARGARFEHVIAESSWTLPSHMSMFTGLAPTEHGVTLPNLTLSPEIVTLPEHFRHAGYRTFGKSEGRWIAGHYGFARGFETFDDGARGLASSLRELKAMIESYEEEEHYFAFIHTYDVHCPYVASAESVRVLVEPRGVDLDTRGKCGNPHYNGMRVTPAQVAHLSDLYDAGIRDADVVLGDFVRFLDARGELERTVLILTSDHGEEFKEHGQIGHERTLFNESLRIPLIVVGPHVSPRVLQHPANLADVAATVADLAGLPAAGFTRESLASVILSGAGQDPTRPLFSELDRHVRLRSVVLETAHLIAGPGARRSLYDIERDPREQQSLSAAEPERLERMDRLLNAYFESITAGTGQLRELTPAEVERLRSLGYVE